jgi:hypothetical protein
LRDHRHPFVTAIPGHRLSLVAEVLELIYRRHGHKQIVALCKPSRN